MNMYYYLLRELPNKWVANHRATPCNKRHVIRNDMNNFAVVATATRPEGNPLYQNWIYKMNSEIFVWVDPTDPNADITIDMLNAFGVPDWSNETFTQYTTIAIMYPNPNFGYGKSLATLGPK